MPLTLVNQTNYNAASLLTDHFVAIPQPAAGNLLVICSESGASRDATNPCFTSDGANGNIVNLTKAIEIANGVTDITNIYFKIAAGTNEARAHVKLTASTSAVFTVLEYSGNLASPLDVTVSNTGTVSPDTTGTSAATTLSGDELAVMAIGDENAGTFSAPTNSGGGSLSPTWTLLVSLKSTTGSSVCGVASAPVSGTGTLNGQQTQSGAGIHYSAALATFAAPPPPYQPGPFPRITGLGVG